MAQHCCTPWLVDSDPVLDSVTKAAEAQLGVFDKVVHDLGVQPAVLLNLQGRPAAEIKNVLYNMCWGTKVQAA
jgi:hypothetical protein